MFWKKIEDMSQDEKIDYVFNYIRKEKRSKMIWFIFRLFFRCIIFFIWYSFYTNADKFNMEKMLNQYVVPKLSSLATDISKNIMNDMSKNIWWLWTWWIDINNIQSQMSDQMMNNIQSQISDQMIKQVQSQLSSSMWDDFQKKMLKIIQATVAKQVKQSLQEQLNQVKK